MSQAVEIVEHHSDHPALGAEDPHGSIDEDPSEVPDEDEPCSEEMEEEEPTEWQAILAHMRSYAIGHDPEAELAVQSQPDALPLLGRPLNLALRLPTPAEIRSRTGQEQATDDNVLLQADWVIAIFSMVFVGTGQLVRDYLAGFRYLGPNRSGSSARFLSTAHC